MTIISKSAIFPKALKSSDVIGVVAPAGAFDRNRFDMGIADIHRMGFKTRVDEGIYRRKGFLAGDDHHRAVQFNAMVADEGVRAIVCARGGYGCLRLLDHVDYEAFVRDPKPLVGFSDITALHRAIHLKTGLITFHGPMVTTLRGADEASRQSWGNTLMGACDLTPAGSGLRILKEGTADGVLAGGNLATLCHLLGTPYCGDYSGAILLIEDVGEASYRIDRMLTQMIMAGVLDGIAGIVVGTFEDCGPPEEIEAVVLDRFQNVDIPIVSGMPVGHGRENLTVPLGARVRLDTRGAMFSLVGPVFQAAGNGAEI